MIKNNFRILKKQYAYLQTILKTPVKFQKDWPKTVGGVADTRMVVGADGRTNERTDIIQRRTDRQTDILPLFSHSRTPRFKILATPYTMKLNLVVLQAFIKFLFWHPRMCLCNGPRIPPKELDIFCILILLDGNFKRRKILKFLCGVQLLRHFDKSDAFIFLGNLYILAATEYAVT